MAQKKRKVPGLSDSYFFSQKKMDIAQLLKDWFQSEKTEVDPSLLAYVLLCKIYIFFIL